MTTVFTNRKLNTKSMNNKYHALKEVGDGNPQSKVALKYEIPKNTLSTQLKNKEKIFELVMKGNNSKHLSLREGSFTNLNQVIFKWLLVVRSSDIAVSSLILKSKATEFTEKMNVKIFMPQMTGQTAGKNDITYHSKSFLVKPTLLEETTLPIILSK